MIEIKVNGGRVQANFEGNLVDILKGSTYAMHVMAKSVARSGNMKLNEALDLIYTATSNGLDILERAEGTEIAMPTDIKGDKK